MIHGFTVSLGLKFALTDEARELIAGAVARVDDSLRVKNLTVIVSTDHPEDFLAALFDYFSMRDFRWLNVVSN